MELIAYMNAQYCSVIFPYIIYFLGYMYYAISVPLIMTENCNFDHIHIRGFLSHYFLMHGLPKHM